MLLVDHRERHVIAELDSMGVAYTIKTLDIGDFQISADLESVPLAIWERKTYSDLAASLNDKRYREQKHRLTTSSAQHKGYIIEGKCPTGKFRGLHAGTVDSIRLGLMCRDGFKIIASNDARHTAQILSKMLKKLPTYTETSTEEREDKYHCALVQSSISSVKKENLTPELCYLAQLCQIPQVSWQTAKAIQAKYPNLKTLLDEISTDRRAAVKTISNLTNASGRRIGPSVATKIASYLLPAIVKVKVSIKKKVV